MPAVAGPERARGGQILQIYREWFGRFAEESAMALKALYQVNATPE